MGENELQNENNNVGKNNDENKSATEYKLCNWQVIFLFIYYMVIMILGLALTLVGIADVYEEKCRFSIILYALLLSMLGSIVLSALYYSRKLYKLHVQDRITLVKQSKESRGIFFYFFFRPLYAAVFSVVLVMLLLSGLIAITGLFDNVINSRFVYVSFSISAMFGYAIGSVLDEYGNRTKKTVDKVLEIK